MDKTFNRSLCITLPKIQNYLRPKHYIQDYEELYDIKRKRGESHEKIRHGK